MDFVANSVEWFWTRAWLIIGEGIAKVHDEIETLKQKWGLENEIYHYYLSTDYCGCDEEIVYVSKGTQTVNFQYAEELLNDYSASRIFSRIDIGHKMYLWNCSFRLDWIVEGDEVLIIA